jgi:hypothetical protein
MTFFTELSSLIQGQEDKAANVLKWLRGPNYDIKAEMEMIKKSIEIKSSTSFAHLTSSRVWKPLLIMILMISLQVTNINNRKTH